MRDRAFALLLCITMSIVDIDGASDQCPKDNEELDVTVQSSSIFTSPEAVRRLDIFESIIKSGDQHNDDCPMSIGYKGVSPDPESDESVNEILQHSLIELTDTLRTLELNDPSKSMRIPVHLIPKQSPESRMVFQSLLELLSNPKESRSCTPLEKYLMESIGNQSCSEVDLCKKFHQNFKCGEEDHVKVITFYGNSTFDHLNLLMIPNTVEILNVNFRRTKLKTISEWTDLKGKSLKKLRLDANYGLKLNLDGLQGELSHLPLEYLSVSTQSIENYFGGNHWKIALTKIGDWMSSSTLTSFRLRSPRKQGSRYTIHFDCDGSWTIASVGKQR